MTARRLGGGLLVSLLLHGLLLWRWMAQDAAPPQATQAWAPRLQILWVKPEAAPPPPRLPDFPRTTSPAPVTSAARPPHARRPGAAATPAAAEEAIAQPSVAPADAAAPVPASAQASGPDPHRSAKAMGRLLDSAAGRQAVQAAARQDSVVPQAPARHEDPLASAMREAAHGDCMKGEFKGAGMGLLSLPMLAAAAMQGECSR